MRSARMAQGSPPRGERGCRSYRGPRFLRGTHVSTSTTAAPSPRSHRPAAPQPCSFAELGVPARLVAALAAGGITEPFPVQAATLPDALAGRDILGRARTGSGKTVAFAVPVAAVLAASARPRRRNAPRAVVLLPTRELAGQVAKTIAPLA